MGGAKSGGGRRIVLYRALKYPGTRHLILRRLSKQLIDNHITALFREYPKLQKGYVKSEKTLNLTVAGKDGKVAGMSQVVFGYAEHPAHDMQGDIYDWQGSEWATIFIDEAQQFNQEEISFMKTRCRCPGMVDIYGRPGTPKLMLTFNPGGRGHNYLKRVFVDNRAEKGEDLTDLTFIRAYGWDNVEWMEDYLATAKLTKAEYYDKLTDDQRKQMFLAHSPYGKVLNALRGKMRMAYLEGDWDAFAGQFFDIWDADEAVVKARLEAWWPRWVSIDWGYEHNAAVYWHTQSDSTTITYRELVAQHMSPELLGETIAKMSEGERIDDVYLSPDAFELSRRQWLSKDTIAEQLGNALEAGHLPYPSRADNDRIGGWRLMHQLLTAGLWKIDASCVRLIGCIPELQRDEDEREDVLKVDCDEEGKGGDDPADSARYGLKSRLKTPRPPLDIRVKDHLEQYVKGRGITIQDLDPTAYAMMMRRARALEKPKLCHRVYRPGRQWQPMKQQPKYGARG
jgi:phage terminase large subunit